VGFRDPTRPNILNKLNKIIRVSDGSGYVAAGEYSITYPDFSANLFGWLVKASPEGDSLWSRSLRFFEEDDNLHYLYNVKEAPDGGFIMVGQANEYYAEAYPQQAWIIKVDQYGCLIPGCHLVDDVEDNYSEHLELAIYPNPSSDYLNFQLRGIPKSKGGIFRIVDSQGKTIRTLAPLNLNDTCILSIVDWADGVYFLQYLEEGEIFISSKFVKY
jgi:hypothetical protein